MKETNVKKVYEKPETEIILFETEDVITDSALGQSSSGELSSFEWDFE